MPRILKENSDFARRVENVMQALEENNVRIEFLGGEFRFSDTSDNAPEYRQNMRLLETENGTPVCSLPSFFEYKLAIFNS